MLKMANSINTADNKMLSIIQREAEQVYSPVKCKKCGSIIALQNKITML